MGILLECINRFRCHNKKNSLNQGNGTVFEGYNYSTKDDYLEKQGFVSDVKGNYTVLFYASAHDDVGITIKQLHPYKYLFKYTGLNYYIINDDFDFKKIIILLNKIVETNKKEGYEKAFMKLEQLVQGYILDYIQEISNKTP